MTSRCISRCSRRCWPRKAWRSPSSDYHERYLGYDDRGCFEAALRDAGQSADRARLDELIARKARRYVEVAEQGLRFFPAAAETLPGRRRAWPVAINSGALRPEIEYALGGWTASRPVAAIVSAEDTDKCKPDPEGYRLALEALRARRGSRRRAWRPGGTLASACLVIEDSLAGIVSAKGAGMWAVGVTTTYDADRSARPGPMRHRCAGGLTPEWIERQFWSLVIGHWLGYRPSCPRRPSLIGPSHGSGPDVRDSEPMTNDQ